MKKIDDYMTDHIGDINELVFSDEELERLKEELKKQSVPYNISLNSFYFGTLNAILARMEAAEECVYALETIEELRKPCYYPCLAKWRKVAGKTR